MDHAISNRNLWSRIPLSSTLFTWTDLQTPGVMNFPFLNPTLIYACHDIKSFDTHHFLTPGAGYRTLQDPKPLTPLIEALDQVKSPLGATWRARLCVAGWPTFYLLFLPWDLRAGLATDHRLTYEGVLLSSLTFLLSNLDLQRPSVEKLFLRYPPFSSTGPHPVRWGRSMRSFIFDGLKKKQLLLRACTHNTHWDGTKKKTPELERCLDFDHFPFFENFT